MTKKNNKKNTPIKVINLYRSIITAHHPNFSPSRHKRITASDEAVFTLKKKTFSVQGQTFSSPGTVVSVHEKSVSATGRTFSTAG